MSELEKCAYFLIDNGYINPITDGSITTMVKVYDAGQSYVTLDHDEIIVYGSCGSKVIIPLNYYALIGVIISFSECTDRVYVEDNYYVKKEIR